MNSISNTINSFKKLPFIEKVLAIGLTLFIVFLPISIASYKSILQRTQKPNLTPTITAPLAKPIAKPTLMPFPTTNIVPLQLIIQFKEGQGPGENADAVRRNAIKNTFDEAGVISQEKLYQSTNTKLRNYYLLKFRQGTDLSTASKKIYALPEIKTAEPNYENKLFNSH